MIVRFTLGGRRQFLAAVRYIAERNPPAARRFRVRAEKYLRRLQRFPTSGRRLPEFPELPHREVIVRPYRFFKQSRRDVERGSESARPIKARSCRIFGLMTDAFSRSVAHGDDAVSFELDP